MSAALIAGRGSRWAGHRAAVHPRRPQAGCRCGPGEGLFRRRTWPRYGQGPRPGRRPV